jgi:hypothetical protein
MHVNHDAALKAVHDAVLSSEANPSTVDTVDALRAVEACGDNTRRMAIDILDRHIKQGNQSRDLVNLLIALRRV